MLLSLGVDNSMIVQEERKNALTVLVYLDSLLEANKLAVVIRRVGLRGVKTVVNRRSASDWSERWKKGWKPFALTRRFHVIPLWQESRRCPSGKQPVYLDTTNAFGTGLHETTRFSAQLIDQAGRQCSSFLDVGTGSGILAIVAGKLGIKDVVAIDIDPDAVKVARKNLKVNHLPANRVLVADIGRFRPGRMFDLVVANLVTWDLVAFRNKILPLVKPGGYLIVSGISLKNLPFFREYFRVRTLKQLKLKKGREWAAFLFQKMA
jgi:ribosomal protein L11 methyltransferase